MIINAYNTRILGLVAPKKSGKDTFYKLCLELYLEGRLKFHPIRLAFADELKKEVAKMQDVSVGDINKDKEKYRVALQTIGVARREQDKEYWVNKLTEELASKLAKQKRNTLYIITDVRFLNEAAFVQSHGGKLLKIRRTQAYSNDQHISETEMRSIVTDSFLDNDQSELLFKSQILDYLNRHILC